jgi:hypothetical protein
MRYRGVLSFLSEARERLDTNGHEEHPKRPSQGLLRPGRFLWARAVPWCVVFGIALWISYKFVKGVGIDSGLDGSSGVPTLLGVVCTKN